ncbi:MULTISPECIES: fimbrial biogenesis chaperone [Rahnella]|jgi:fimbrial chaperone protein|uniref:Molecular chaperone n=1 Tax=Rahnella sp. (strain Y9602) TaxID=2703885 RepID=A0ABW6C3J1_RAHSY|nr:MULTISPECIES: molecular chaperone [Rahnella]AYA08756.1 molecular chaperone [Rahnella aquatilis]AZP52690.1 molecular chaperone [Rahnella aquatilis]MBU9843345.1 molecular chaperone [Rahnella aceris]MBU9863762.1 molecular chaperone [Rahnella aceris]MCM2446174.1 molecular chaperone [Rahnella sp. CG8]
MKRAAIFICGLLGLCFIFQATAGVTVGATRVVFSSDMKETSLSVNNTGIDSAFLVRSWVSNFEDESKASIPFIATPPLFRIEKNQNSIIRIALKSAAGLPQDRESIYWMNVLVIPPSQKKSDEGGSLQFSVNNRLKLIYRPAALNNQDLKDIYSKVKFSRSGEGLTVTNPTPYYVSFGKITVNNSPVTESVMVPPLASTKIKKAPMGNDVSWTVIDDYGGISKLSHAKI